MTENRISVAIIADTVRDLFPVLVEIVGVELQADPDTRFSFHIASTGDAGGSFDEWHKTDPNFSVTYWSDWKKLLQNEDFDVIIVNIKSGDGGDERLEAVRKLVRQTSGTTFKVLMFGPFYEENWASVKF